MQPETPATQKEKNAASKTICVRNLSFDVQRAEMYVLIFLVVLIDYYRFKFFTFKCFSVKIFSKIVEKLLMSVCMWMLSLQPQKQQRRQVFWPCIVFTNHFRTANSIPWIVVHLYFWKLYFSYIVWVKSKCVDFIMSFSFPVFSIIFIDVRLLKQIATLYLAVVGALLLL